MGYGLMIQALRNDSLSVSVFIFFYLGYETDEFEFHDNGLDHFVEKVDEITEYDMSDNNEEIDADEDPDEDDVEYEGELEPAEESNEETDQSDGSDFEESLSPVEKSRKPKSPRKQKRSLVYVNRKKLGISNTSCEVCFKELESTYRLYRHR